VTQATKSAPAVAPVTAGSAWKPPRWVSPTAVLLSLAGLSVSSYLTVAHYSSVVTLACPDSGVINCQKVTTSPQSLIFGVPVAVLGVVFFAAMLLLNSPRAWRQPGVLIRLTRIVLATFGVGFAVYLIYSELFTVHAICLWCTGAHVLAFLLFVALAFAECLARPNAGMREVANGQGQHLTPSREDVVETTAE
jgi:uncharacterized membrane protein